MQAQAFGLVDRFMMQRRSFLHPNFTQRPFFEKIKKFTRVKKESTKNERGDKEGKKEVGHQARVQDRSSKSRVKPSDM
jgi:hypothetical protein